MVTGWFEQGALTGTTLEAFLADTRTQAFIVIQDDTVLYEKYFNGLQRDSIVTSFSAAKSFVSTMIGIAIAEGKIGSLDDPDHRLPARAAGARPALRGDITIRHLLNMSSGIKYVETGFVTGDDALTYYYPDLRELALQKTVITRRAGPDLGVQQLSPAAARPHPGAGDRRAGGGIPADQSLATHGGGVRRFLESGQRRDRI